MKKKIKLMTWLVLMAVLVLLVSSCAKTNPIELVDDQLNVVTSFYPLYDFAQKIGGEYVHVVNLVPAGVEPHDWSPKSSTIRAMSRADLLIYHGVGLENWVDDFLHSLPADSKLVDVEASQGISLISATEDADLAEESHQEQSNPNEHHDHGQYDPHTWLSPKNAIQLARNIRDGLIEVDRAHQSAYEKNYLQLEQQLTQLDLQYQQTLSALPKKEIAVSHQAFAYLCRDYGLTQMAIMGLSPDAEPTAQKIKEVNDFIKQHQLSYIFFEELVSDQLATTLAQDLQIQTLVLNPLEGLTDEQLAQGENYISTMQKNLANLKKALQ